MKKGIVIITIILLFVTLVNGYIVWTSGMAIFNSYSVYRFDKNSDINISMTNNINEMLSLQYLNHDIEFVHCIYGYQENDVIVINNAISPEVYNASKNHVYFSMQCPRNPQGTKLLGTIHSHPSGRCDMSKQDIYIFGLRHDIISGIICGDSKYGIYTPNHVSKSHKLGFIQS